jgi:hypothetical protein
VLAGRPEAADRVAAARDIVAGNPVAEASVEQADALLRGDTARTGHGRRVRRRRLPVPGRPDPDSR